MLENSLSQLEGLVRTLVEENRVLLSANAQLATELASFKEENETLQLSLMEQEEKNGSTAARLQALVDRASAGVAGA